MRGWMILVAMAAGWVVPRAWAAETDAYFHGLSAAERAEFPTALQRMVRDTSREVLGAAKVRNHAYTAFLLRETVQRKIEAKEFALSRRQVAGAKAALHSRLIKETREFLEELSPEVDRLARESSTGEELAQKLAAIADGVDQWAGAKAVPVAEPGKLAPTEPNIEGPFYRPNAPFSNRLTPADAQGQILHIAGAVFDTEGKPIRGALVDVWQADKDGAYDIADPQDRNNPRFPLKFRARMRAEDGKYEFFTVVPGAYEIGENKWRCKHVHYKVSAPGFESLTTQLYFEGDPLNGTDPWWKASTTIPLSGPFGAQPLSGIFNVVLKAKRS